MIFRSSSLKTGDDEYMSAQLTTGFISNARGEVVIRFRRVRSPLKKMKGLIASSRMEPGEGLLFAAKRVHTFAMRRPIDIVHLSGSGSVLDAYRLDPASIGRRKPGTKWILELEEGESERANLTPGANVLLEWGSE